MSLARARYRAQGRRRLRIETLEARQMLDATGVAFSPLAGEAEDAPMPDFAIQDVNSTSATYQQNVSPRQLQDNVSGWYFGSAL